MVFMKSPEQGAQTSIFAATAAEAAGKNGAYYSDCKLKDPAGHCRDEATAKRLWEVSEQLSGMVYPT
jgi:retinol dehydrogenase-13